MSDNEQDEQKETREQGEPEQSEPEQSESKQGESTNVEQKSTDIAVREDADIITPEMHIEITTLAALGFTPTECITKLREKYGSVDEKKIKHYLRRKSVKHDIEQTRRALNKDIEKIPIANRAVQVRVLGDILLRQQNLSDQLIDEKPNLGVQLLNDARTTVRHIAEISGTINNPTPQQPQDNRRQTNIITAIVGDDVPKEAKKAVINELSAIIKQATSPNGGETDKEPLTGTDGRPEEGIVSGEM